MRIGKFLGVIAGFLVCVSLIRTVNIDDPAKDDVRLYDVLLTVQNFEYDTTAINQITSAFDHFKEIDVIKNDPYNPFDDSGYRGGSDDETIVSRLARLSTTVAEIYVVITDIIRPIGVLIFDTFSLAGDVIALSFRLLGFSY